MDSKKLIQDVSVAFLAQGISLLLSIITSLVVPKLLGVEEFAYWQLFLFYSSYVGFFHLGLNDGVYLINGGKPRESVDKSSLRSQFYVGLFFQTVMALMIAAMAFLGGLESQREFVVVSCSIFLLIYNASGYLGYVFQAMNETKLFSFSVMIDRVTFLIPLVALLIFRCPSFEPYVISYILARVACLAYCAWKGRDILSSNRRSFGDAFRDTVDSIRVGIKLMFANVASMLILGIARFVIDFSWGIEAFGELSFSLSMVNFVLTFVAQVSMVLFPALRQADCSELVSIFEKLRAGLALFLPATYLFYIPIKIALVAWLPQYADSLDLFALLLPLCVFDGNMNMLGTTYLKVLRFEKSLLFINCFTVALSAVSSFAGVFVFHSQYFVIAGAVVAIILRALFAEFYLEKKIKAKRTLLSFGAILMTGVFLIAALFLSDLFAFFVYAIAYMLFLLANRNKLNLLLQKIHKRFS